MDLYRDLIIDLSKNPLNKRGIPHADVAASGANISCGDRFRLSAKLAADGTLTDVAFEGEGCAISTASASLLTEEAKGKTAAEVLQWNTQTVFEWLGTDLGPSRAKCGLLPLETLQKALKPA